MLASLEVDRKQLVDLGILIGTDFNPDGIKGIGPKTASRLTYYLLRMPDEQSLSLAQALQDLKAKTRFCSVCFNITDAAVDPCGSCRAERREGARCMR